MTCTKALPVSDIHNVDGPSDQMTNDDFTSRGDFRGQKAQRQSKANLTYTQTWHTNTDTLKITSVY